MKVVHTYINNMYISRDDEGKECFADRWHLPGLVKKGYEVVLICGGTNRKKCVYFWKGIKVIELPVLFGLSNTTCVLKGFIKELWRENPDIIHTHHYCLLLPEISLIIGGLHKKPVFITMHNSFRSQRNIMKLFEFLYGICMQPFLLFYNKAFFPQDYYLKKGFFPLLSPNNKILCRNQYTLSEKKSFKKKHRAPNKILFLGRLNSIKGVDTLIKACAEVIRRGFRIELHVVGEGPEFDNLNKLVHDFSLSQNVFFHGSLYGDKKWEMFYNSTLLVLPHFDFAESNVHTEGILRKIPILVSSRWCLPKKIRKNKHITNMVVFDPLNYKELAKKMTYLLENKKERDYVANVLYESNSLQSLNNGGEIISYEYRQTFNK